MNNYKQQQKLHSPLLEGTYNQKKKQILFSENKKSIDETLDRTLFNKSDKTPEIKKQKKVTTISLSAIEALENIFKITGSIVVAVGGIFCILQLINIGKVFISGGNDFPQNLLIFSIGFIVTITANAICLGFTHLIRTTKYMYLSVENLNAKFQTMIKQ